MTRRALLVVNRRSKRGADSADQVAAELSTAGIEVADAREELPAPVSTLDVELIVIAGGDGTLNRSAERLVEWGLPLGVVPLGTANDLARTLGLPLDIPGACRTIAEGNALSIDLGQVNDRLFFNVATLGLAVEVTRALQTDHKRRFGRLAYLLTALRVALRVRRFSAQIESAEGVVETHSLQIAVGNGRSYGGGLTIAVDAAIDDGRLDLYSIELPQPWKLLGVLWRLRTGWMEPSPYLRTLSGAEFRITTRRPRPVSADGEIVTHTPARFCVARRRVRVFVPRSPAT